MSKKIALTNMDIVWEDKESNMIQCEEMSKRSKTRRSDTVPILRYDIRSLFI